MSKSWIVMCQVGEGYQSNEFPIASFSYEEGAKEMVQTLDDRRLRYPDDDLIFLTIDGRKVTLQKITGYLNFYMTPVDNDPVWSMP